jgi:hypothetical protein
MGGRASVLVEIVICFGGVVRQGICESRFFLKPGGGAVAPEVESPDPVASVRSTRSGRATKMPSRCTRK